MAYDTHAADGIRVLLEGQRVVEKRMMGGLVFMVGGHMCITASGRGGILVRVGPEAQARVLKEPHVKPMIMAGRTANGFERVMPEGYRTTASLRKWVKRGLDYVATLPPKKTAPRKASARGA